MSEEMFTIKPSSFNDFRSRQEEFQVSKFRLFHGFKSMWGRKRKDTNPYFMLFIQSDSNQRSLTTAQYIQIIDMFKPVAISVLCDDHISGKSWHLLEKDFDIHDKWPRLDPEMVLEFSKRWTIGYIHEAKCKMSQSNLQLLEMFWVVCYVNYAIFVSAKKVLWVLLLCIDSTKKDQPCAPTAKCTSCGSRASNCTAPEHSKLKHVFTLFHNWLIPMCKSKVHRIEQPRTSKEEKGIDTINMSTWYSKMLPVDFLWFS